jgi:type IV secretory pathway TrbF-like protein
MQTEVVTEALPDTLIKEAASEKARRFKREWEERYSSLLAGRRHWKIIAGAQTIVIAGLCVALWDMGRQAHTPDVVVLEKSGSQIAYAGPVQPQSMDDATWDLVRVEQLKKFISAWRTVTSDVVAQNADWDMSFAFVGDNSQARAALSKWYEENDPVKRGAKGELSPCSSKRFTRR